VWGSCGPSRAESDLTPEEHLLLIAFAMDLRRSIAIIAQPFNFLEDNLKHRTALYAAAAFLIGTLKVATGAELVANPGYGSWAKHKPGTKVVMQMEVQAQGMTMKQDLTQTLAEVTPEKAVIDVIMVMNMGGMKQEHKDRQDIPAKVEKGREYLPQDMKGTIKETGKESVEVAGGKYNCTVMEFSGESAQGAGGGGGAGASGKTTGKLWYSEEIPGGLAKMESSMAAPAQASIKATVTSIQKK
jgi:hypothetical protein